MKKANFREGKTNTEYIPAWDKHGKKVTMKNFVHDGYISGVEKSYYDYLNYFMYRTAYEKAIEYIIALSNRDFKKIQQDYTQFGLLYRDEDCFRFYLFYNKDGIEATIELGIVYLDEEPIYRLFINSNMIPFEEPENISDFTLAMTNALMKFNYIIQNSFIEGI